MDAVLCDELWQEIFRRLPAASSPSVSLVSKRWLLLLRSSASSLSLRLPSTSPPPSPSLSLLLSHYPSLSALTLVSSSAAPDETPYLNPSDALLLAVAASPCSRRLAQLRFLRAGSPLSPSSLLSASASLSRLTSLSVSCLLPLSFRWLSAFPFLKSFSLVGSHSKIYSDELPIDEIIEEDEGEASSEDVFFALPLESLSLSGIRAADRGLSWLWRRCRNLRWLQLRACGGTGDGPASSSLALCLAGLLGLELRTCRTIADRILLLAADNCRSLTSLLLYDGGGRDALHHFIHQRGAALRTLDLRLPLDLHNDHLLAIASDQIGVTSRGPGLLALRLQSCCLVTGDGLRSLARAPVGAAIEELALVNCDVVDREPGLLTFLGQSMRRLRRLDLSHNETLADKEVGAMLASCRNLVDIRLRGCARLTGASLSSMLKHCGRSLEAVDISWCPGIGIEAIEIFALNTPRLSELIVEESKVSESARAMASRKAIKIG